MKLPKAVYVLLSWYLVGPAAGDQNAAFIQFDAPQFLIQCEPTKLTWQGGKCVIFWSNGPFDEPLQQYSNVTVNSVTWGTNVTAGLPVVFILDDSAGNGYGSASIVVQIGSDQSCLNLDSSKTNTSTTTAIGAGDAVSTNPASRTGSSQFASTATVEPTGSVATTGPRRSVPLIVGAAVGGTGGIMLTVIGALLLRRRYARKRDHVQPQMLQTNPGPLNQAELSLAMSEKSRGEWSFVHSGLPSVQKNGTYYLGP
ncbi:hypothetical protein GY45DRAFT_1318448 [Cubamyces sp. BRFM 1775]|nr:hypothetical protein GY45DRAFT_1318448 [Cubamyces sp. BRFM 1775]